MASLPDESCADGDNPGYINGVLHCFSSDDGEETGVGSSSSMTSVVTPGPGDGTTTTDTTTETDGDGNVTIVEVVTVRDADGNVLSVDVDVQGIQGGGDFAAFCKKNPTKDVCQRSQYAPATCPAQVVCSGNELLCGIAQIMQDVKCSLTGGDEPEGSIDSDDWTDVIEDDVDTSSETDSAMTWGGWFSAAGGACAMVFSGSVMGVAVSWDFCSYFLMVRDFLSWVFGVLTVVGIGRVWFGDR